MPDSFIKSMVLGFKECCSADDVKDVGDSAGTTVAAEVLKEGAFSTPARAEAPEATVACVIPSAVISMALYLLQHSLI
jgi:hypothetical protein